MSSVRSKNIAPRTIVNINAEFLLKIKRYSGLAMPILFSSKHHIWNIMTSLHVLLNAQTVLMEHGSNDRNSVDRANRYPFLDYYAVMNRVREGTLSSGEKFKPFPWLEANTMPKPKQQVAIEKAMESCTFKTLLSCVMGKYSNGSNY